MLGKLKFFSNKDATSVEKKSEEETPLLKEDKSKNNEGTSLLPDKNLPTIYEVPPTFSSNDTSVNATNDVNIETPNDVQSVKKLSGASQKLLFAIMLLVNVLGPLSTEAQVPALQDIADDLNTTSQWVQLTITIYMLMFGASQLWFGTLSDIYGRRNTLLFGLTVYVLCNIGCALAPNIIALNIFRAIQAMGSGAGMVIVYAIARDVFEQEQRTFVLGVLSGLRPIVIASSPIFGGTVAAFLGWRYIFFIIGGLSLLLLILVFFLLPETRDPTTSRITTFTDYKNTVNVLIKNPVFVGLVMISGAVYAGVFIMFNEFSFVMGDRYGFNEFVIGLLCGLIVFGLMVGSIFSIVFVKYLTAISVVRIGLILLILTGGILVLPLVLYGTGSGLTFYWTIVPLFLYVTCDGFMLPHIISASMEPYKKIAGTASAISGFWRFFSAAVIALVVSSCTGGYHLQVLHLGTASMTILCVIIYFATLYGRDTEYYLREHDGDETGELAQTQGVKVIDHIDDDDDVDKNKIEQNNSLSYQTGSISSEEEHNNTTQQNEKMPLIKKSVTIIEA